MPSPVLRRLGLLLLGLVACSLVATAAVHAGETLNVPAVCCSDEAHAEGDRAPADADHAVPHHHSNCHGHAFALEADAQATPRPHRLSSHNLAGRAQILASRTVDPALRPPRA